jgi:hypothetical protein
MDIVIRRNSTVYDSRESAISALGSLTYELGLLVCATYTESSETKVILALGIGSGVGQYKIIASYSDIVDVVDALSALSSGVQNHIATLADGTTSGHVVDGDSSDITWTKGIGTVKDNILELTNIIKSSAAGIIGIKAASIAAGSADYSHLSWAETISEIEAAGSVTIATISGQPIVLSGKAGEIKVEIQDSITLPGNPKTGKTIAVDGALDKDDSLSIATVDYVRKKIDSLMSAADAMTYKGTIDPTTTSLPAASAGDTYVVSSNATEGTDKTGLGVLHIGDLLICKSDSTAAGTAASWDLVETHKDTIFGPSTSTSGNLMAFDGTTGKVAKDSGIAASEVVTDSRKVTAGTGLELSSSNSTGALSADVKISHSTLTPTVTGTSGTGKFVSAIGEDSMGHVNSVTYTAETNLSLTSGSNVTSGEVSGDNYFTGISVSGHTITVKGAELPGKVRVDSTGKLDYLINQIIPKATLGTDEYAVSLAKNSTSGKIEASVVISRIDGGTY